MERRGFLKGLLTSITSTGLIVAAKPEEIAALALAPDAALVVAPQPDPALSVATLGESLFNDKGELVAIITGVNVEPAKSIELTTFGDSNKRFMVGRNVVTIEAECVRAVRISTSQSGLRVGARQR